MMKVSRETARTYEQWCEFYEEKTGERVSLPSGFALYFLEEMGFCQVRPIPEDKTLVVYQTVGDGLFWRNFAEVICKVNGFDYLQTFVTRRVRPYMRLFGWKIVREWDMEGVKRFLCRDKLGRDVLLTQSNSLSDKGEPVFIVTQYLNGRCDLNGW